MAKLKLFHSNIMELPNITNKQQQLPILLTKFRFLHSAHFQSLLKQKDKRRINKWLKDLTEKKYLVRISSTLPEEDNRSAVYRMGLNGIRFLKTQKRYSTRLIKNLYRENERSQTFINQCLLLADIYLTLRDKISTDVEYTAIVANDIINNPSLEFLAELNPQLYFIKQEGDQQKNYYLLELFEPTLPNYSVKKRIKKYIEFFWSNEWENNVDDPFPIILLVCPSKSKLQSAKRATKKLFEEEQDPEGLRIRFTTLDEIKKQGVIGEIWEEVV